MKNCKGKCSTSCGPVPMSKAEHDVIEDVAGPVTVQPGHDKMGLACSMLTEDGQCSVYDLRPLLCRIWGAAHRLKCPYGCEPERYLTDQEIWELMYAASALTGQDPGAAMDEMLERMGPEFAALWEGVVLAPTRQQAREGKVEELTEKP